MTANTACLVELIKVECRRLDTLETGHGGAVVEAPDNLPDGWITIADESATIYGLASEVLASLKGALPGETVDSANATDSSGHHVGYEALWAALENYLEFEPTAKDWFDFHDFTGINTRSGEIGVIVLRTNAGLRWGFAPTESDFSAFNSTHDFSDRFAKASEALEAAEDFEAEEKAVAEAL